MIAFYQWGRWLVLVTAITVSGCGGDGIVKRDGTGIGGAGVEIRNRDGMGWAGPGPIPVAGFCMTNFGSCQMQVEVAVGSFCFCRTPMGSLSGIAR
jgi:hypothetical protein